MHPAATLRYDNSLKIADALQIFFSTYHFDNGGYHLKWFTIKIGMLHIPLPNTRSRLAAVKIHDIHHLLTEYEANLKGESEIGAWEIARGCGNNATAWLLNFAAFFFGMIAFPRALLRAFLRGRACRTNFYYDTVYDEMLLNKSIGELREYIGLDRSKNYKVKDYLMFIFYCLLLISAAVVPVWIFCLVFEIN